eukprot:CAMPEP_0176433698 /NCGR_PEP_ID=MMETSP0127-20121128/16193_1 /TAXON_ID=938130 /ORGANISM="Platyophrya macrostoma, Strain WH" /LENGTH=354 /DNA_ID=CAMNT_0017816207 /DNA_START=36 /DNA_END=1100 /DNA_ORIENTATION=-
MMSQQMDLGLKIDEEIPLTLEEIENYDVEELLQLGEENLENMRYQNCQLIYERAYALDPKNERVLSAFGFFLSTIKQTELARKVLSEAIYLAPDENAKKYLHIAELYNGNDAATFYFKAIEILIKDIQKSDNIFYQNVDYDDLKKDLSQAYSALGELYMSDLCKTENAQSHCLNFLLKSIETDNQNLDAYYQLANYFLETDDPDKAKESILKLIELYAAHHEKEDGFLDGYNNEFFLGVAKVCIELEFYNQAILILDDLVRDDEKNAEFLYNNAYCNFMVKNYITAAEYVKDLNEFDLSFDPELQAAKKELEGELQKIDVSQAMDNDKMREDEDWEDEDDEEQKMDNDMEVEMK